tara:strand:+ start:2434 stop:2589 length:156 start_codon:yes stop_codon:yes gene_type:complete
MAGPVRCGALPGGVGKKADKSSLLPLLDAMDAATKVATNSMHGAKLLTYLW